MAFMDHGRIIGVAPAFEARSVLFGRRLVSQPFSEYGGLLLDPNLTDVQLASIFGHLEEFIRSSRLSCFELHGRQGAAMEGATHYLKAANEHQHAVLPLDRQPEALYTEVVTYQVRKAIQKAQRSGVTVEERSDEETIRRDFYPYYLDSMKRLGAPPHSIDYYLECKKAFGQRMRIFWALLEGKPIAGLLGFSSGSRVMILNIVSDARAWDVRPNDLIHWEYIQWACREGFRMFDFGSIRYEGQLHYKKKWGCSILPHAYYFVGASDGEKAATFNSSSQVMKGFSQAWAKYVPQPAATLLGPFLRKNLIR
jgi:CelD/BcsL family acetyltransferase involved in cellulose biosynthesis